MSQPQPANVRGMDVPIVNLIPLRRRKVSERDYKKLLANIKAVGLIEPLCICQEGEKYFILDGFIRYTILVELGVERVPCLVLDSRDLYTPNRQVSHLSPRQQITMLRQALEQLDEQTVANAFGMDSLKTRLNTSLYRDMHADVVEALKKGELQQGVAKELAFVVPTRQAGILRLMRESRDFSSAFAKIQVLATPLAARSKRRRRNSPWEKRPQIKRDMVKKLAEVEKHYDFYTTLYRQYAGDLVKLSIYVRQLVTEPTLREYLQKNRPADIAFFDKLLTQGEGKVAM